MALILYVKQGPLAGQTLPIRAGAIIGRAGSDINLNDGKVSARHAQINANSQGKLALVDLGSRNGLKIQGKKEAFVNLMPGVVVQIGGTFLEVREQAGQVSPRPEAKPLTEPSTWQDILGDFMDANSGRIQDPQKHVLPFPQLIELKFVRGIQLGTTWSLGYGPRTVGGQSIDLPLYEESAPAKAFTIEPDPAGPRFITNHPDQVQLNDSAVSAEKLADGDIIKIGQSWIEVGFIK